MDVVEPVAFGQKPRFESLQRVVLTRENVDLCPRVAVVEPNEELTFLDPVPFLDQKLLDDPAIKMFDRLAVALDLYHPGSDHGAVERGQGGPSPETAKEQGEYQHPCDDGAARAV